MKFSNAHLLLSLLVPASASAQAQAQAQGGGVGTVKLRGKSSSSAAPSYTLSAAAESTCNGLSKQDCPGGKDEDGESCEWCVAGAVPSACYSSGQANSLPPGVFTCTDGVSEQEEEEEEEEKREEHEDEVPSAVDRTEFSFRPSVTHVLEDGPVDPNLCDPSSPKSISGYMSVKGSEYDENGENKHLFFWLFEKRSSKEETVEEAEAGEVEGGDEDPKDIPLVVWLTGGPGCSSSLALLSENGPCSVDKDGASTKINPYGWTESAHVLWLDQPAGVGFSYGEETDSNEAMVSEDAYYFLQAFYKKHPEYSSNPLFVVGESYGGHYAPAIAHKVFVENKKIGGDDDDDDDENKVEGKKNDKKIKINLAGVAVGNGLTDPEEQYKWYPDMVYKNSHNIKVVDESTYEAMKAVVPKCTALIDQCNKGDSFVNTFACQTAFVVCNTGLTSPYRMTGLNPYDIRKKCGLNPLCYDFSHIEKFLNLESTREALHVSDDAPSEWQSCNMGINLKFHTDWMKDFSPYVADMLNGGVPVLIYAGDVDFICNYLGNRAWTLKLEWDRKDDFGTADDHDWNGGKGLARTAGGFTFLQVYDAGHMVPSDQPEAALDMITEFINGGSF
eukprot:CAMPEP_0113551558 /NCGR_PEP_ID=MMETSP0015_2-20120614/14589_1 /TAXON_ID=2838 /ORGANISM="Odontella" /LENGTH=614 /DNA_ID=CAMNT_0000452459 /DNA_START=133 /DNA_END=1977 /DNA_ORIENTATION=+ /assembly_acc=CAM_ASM_000160